MLTANNTLKQPDDTMVGFISLSTVDALFREVETAPPSEALDWMLIEAISRDQHERRGGYRQPYDCGLVSYKLLIVPNPEDFRTPSFNAAVNHALATSDTTGHRIITGTWLIEAQSIEKRLPAGNETCGIWYALSTIDSGHDSFGQVFKLARLIDQESLLLNDMR